MSEPTTPPEDEPKVNWGGAPSHKNPDCRCAPCSARRRKAKAIAIATGEIKPDRKKPGPKPKDILNADIVVQGRSHRDRIAQWAAIRAKDPSLKNTEIAKQLGIAPNSLQHLITRATQEGWLKFEDTMSRMEHEIVPKVIDGLSKLLDEGDKTAIIESAKGTIYKQFLESKGISEAPTTILALKIEALPNPDGSPAQTVQVVTGNVVGKPRSIEGIVEE